MRRFVFYIALFLLPVIALPVIYQPLHIMHHHHGQKNYYIACGKQKKGIHNTSHANTCFICDFEFAFFDISVNTIHASIKCSFIVHDISIQELYISCFCGHHSALRAPPAMG